MTETPDCEHVRPMLEELAIGATTGYERAHALRHVVDCTACRQELSELARVADDVLLLAPRREPPTGFEAEVMRRILGLTDRTERRAPRRAVAANGWRIGHGVRRHRSRAVIRLAAATVVLLLAAVIGAAVTYWQGAPARRMAAQFEQTIGTAGAQYPRAVPITSVNGTVAGHVFLYEGSPAWATVALTAAPESGDYAMSVVTTNGRRYPEGVCTVTGHSGISGYPLPVPLADIAAIDLNRPGLQLTVHP